MMLNNTKTKTVMLLLSFCMGFSATGFAQTPPLDDSPGDYTPPDTPPLDEGPDDYEPPLPIDDYLVSLAALGIFFSGYRLIRKRSQKDITE